MSRALGRMRGWRAGDITLQQRVMVVNSLVYSKVCGVAEVYPQRSSNLEELQLWELWEAMATKGGGHDEHAAGWAGSHTFGDTCEGNLCEAELPEGGRGEGYKSGSSHGGCEEMVDGEGVIGV